MVRDSRTVASIRQYEAVTSCWIFRMCPSKCHQRASESFHFWKKSSDVGGGTPPSKPPDAVVQAFGLCLPRVQFNPGYGPANYAIYVKDSIDLWNIIFENNKMI